MSQDELVSIYMKGKMSRRLFIRKLIATGVSLTAALSYAELLSSPAAAQGLPVTGGDEHGGDDEHGGGEDEHGGGGEHNPPEHAGVLKFGVQSELEFLSRRPSASKHDAKKLREASEKVADSLAPSLWGSDDNHLDPRHGERVFDREREAVEHLRHLMDDRHSSVDGQVLAVLVNDLVRADRLLATIAIAEAGSGRRHDVAAARHELDKAERAIARDKAAQAIEHFKHAWEHASH